MMYDPLRELQKEGCLESFPVWDTCWMSYSLLRKAMVGVMMSSVTELKGGQVRSRVASMPHLFFHLTLLLAESEDR